MEVYVVISEIDDMDYKSKHIEGVYSTEIAARKIVAKRYEEQEETYGFSCYYEIHDVGD